MAHLILCCDIEPVTVQAFGNWFSFKPEQVKSMDPRIVDFLAMDKKEFGFVSLPDICADEPDSAEAKEAKATALAEGRKNIVQKLERLIYNLEVSLQKDFDMANIKTKALDQEGQNYLPHYRKLAKFKLISDSDKKATSNEIAKLKEQINGATDQSDTGTSN